MGEEEINGEMEETVQESGRLGVVSRERRNREGTSTQLLILFAVSLFTLSPSLIILPIYSFRLSPFSGQLWVDNTPIFVLPLTLNTSIV